MVERKKFEVSKAYIKEDYYGMVETCKFGERIDEMWGGSVHMVTREQIYELLSGEYFLHMDNGEYFTIIALTTEEGE